MKNLTKRKLVMLAGAAGALIMLAVMAGAFFLMPMMASANSNAATPTATATNTKKGAAYCQQFEQDLAKRLNISVDTLQQARKGASSDVIDQMVKDGKLKQAQATKIKQRIANSKGQSCPNLGKAKASPAAKIFKKYHTDALQQLAQGLHLSSDQLTAQLKSGKNLTAIATAQHVSSNDLKTLVQNTINSVLKKAVSAGDLTQKRADAITAAIQKHPQFVEKMLKHTGKKQA
ncbi:hypothetical protein KDA_25150 [Dictyobacter alpinus]|uniref:Uncharacterized protein n=1 Tax=Dictyobacter alpinus TaxID=2014873 RepID=A0A402B6P5_9CHLR|nr:hypothetical protein [Dictyobacter alpinus]GCE27031.1 hypothetical protein KDA_25150 [Dictyobacter alpinus]